MSVSSRATALVALLVLTAAAVLLAGCSSSTIDASNLDTKIESAQAFVAEGRFVAEKSDEGKLTAAYRRAHVDALREEIDRIRHQLDATPKEPDVEDRAGAVSSLLDEASPVLTDLADHGDGAAERRLKALEDELEQLRSGD